MKRSVSKQSITVTKQSSTAKFTVGQGSAINIQALIQGLNQGGALINIQGSAVNIQGGVTPRVSPSTFRAASSRDRRGGEPLTSRGFAMVALQPRRNHAE